MDKGAGQGRIKLLAKRSGIILLLIAGLLLLLYLFMLINNPILMKKADQIGAVTGLTVEFTHPGVIVRGCSTQTMLNSSTKFTVELRRKVGHRYLDAGELTGTVSLWGKVSSVTYHWHEERKSDLAFFLPGNIGDESERDLVWETLEGLLPNTLVEMAFSLDDFYPVDQIAELGGNNLEISWYALDTGEQKDLRSGEVPHPFGISDNYWGHNIGPQTTGLSKFEQGWGITRPPFPQGYMEKVAYLVRCPDLYKAIAQLNENDISLEPRYKYLKENGLKTYGIVVHGPVEEMLLLKDNVHLKCPQLGTVEYQGTD